MNKEKILVVYFSHTGENYSNGSIINLKKGNTAVIADKIAKQIKADTFEIKPVSDYPFEYNECTKVAKEELKANSRPDYKTETDISEYRTIILGYPNWWGTMPMVVWTFLESHDFSGKTILPYCTNEGSGMGSSESDLRRLAANADIKKGLAVHGSNVERADAEVKKWLESSL